MTPPGIIVTGASGILGRRVVRAVSRERRVFAIDRRPPFEDELDA